MVNNKLKFKLTNKNIFNAIILKAIVRLDRSSEYFN